MVTCVQAKEHYLCPLPKAHHQQIMCVCLDTLASLRVAYLQVAEKGAWIERRHRNRIAEIIGLVSNLKAEMDDVQAEDEEKY